VIMRIARYLLNLIDNKDEKLLGNCVITSSSTILEWGHDDEHT
jgi:hypothetical protein